MAEIESGTHARPSRPASGTSSAKLRRIAARIPTYLADAVDNPEWLVMFTLGRLLPVRRVYRHWHPATATPPRVGSTMFGERAIDDVVAAVRTDGIFQGLSLPESVAAEIHDFAVATPCFGNMERQLEFRPEDHAAAERQFERPLLTGHYFDRIEQCPAIGAVRRDALLQAIAEAYLGPHARLAATRLWWSFPTRPSEQDLHLASQERFHFDLDDWQTLKFFFYLTPVDAGSGPHVYVRGSHRQRRWKHQLTLLVGQPTEEVLDAHGDGNVLSVQGAPGFGFAEDSFGFHMGTAPKRAPRLMMEVAFGVSAASKRRFYGEPVIAGK
jgi:hypothetical protein